MTRPGAAFGGLATTVGGDETNVTDWLEQAPDLPHLIARLSELVLRLGHAPDDLVILPRADFRMSNC